MTARPSSTGRGALDSAAWPQVMGLAGLGPETGVFCGLLHSVLPPSALAGQIRQARGPPAPRPAQVRRADPERGDGPVPRGQRARLEYEAFGVLCTSLP